MTDFHKTLAKELSPWDQWLLETFDKATQEGDLDLRWASCRKAKRLLAFYEKRQEPINNYGTLKMIFRDVGIVSTPDS